MTLPHTPPRRALTGGSVSRVASVLALAACCIFSRSVVRAQSLALAPGTWAKRPAPAPGRGPAAGGIGKHMAIAAALGKTWWLGGDYPMPNGVDSGRNELWSLNADPWRWTLETASCTGQPQPSGPDQVGWVWDPARALFWMTPGFMWNHQDSCPTTVFRRVMSFNPATKQWTTEDRAPLEMPGTYRYNVFDPVTDSMYALTSTSGVRIYNVRKDEWSTKGFNRLFPGRTIRLGLTRQAIDVEGRTVYAVDHESKLKNLYGYHIDTQQLLDLGPAPYRQDALRAQSVWDSFDHLLYLVQSYGPEARTRLDVYHPQTRQWELIGEDINVEGAIVRGVNTVFDPAQNVLIVGGTNHQNPLPYFFLYRYAAAPAPPSHPASHE